MPPFAELDTTADQLAAAVRALAGGVGVRVEPDPHPLPATWQGSPTYPAALGGVVVVVELGDGDPAPWEFFDRHHSAICRACARLLPHWLTWRLLFDLGDGSPLPLARPGRCRAVGSLVRPPHVQPGEGPMEARAPVPNVAEEFYALFRTHAVRLGVSPENPGWPKFREDLLVAVARMPYHPGEVLGDDLLRIAFKLDARDALAAPPPETAPSRNFS